MKHCILALVLCLLLGSVVPGWAEIVPTALNKISWNGKSVTVEANLVTSKKVEFIALQDLAVLVNGHIDYDRKFDFYTLESSPDKHKIVVVPNSKEVWVDGKRHYYSQQTVMFENLLYLPLRETEKFLTAKAPKPQVAPKFDPKLAPVKPKPSVLTAENAVVLAAISPTAIDIDDAAREDRLPAWDKSTTLSLQIEGVVVDIRPHIIVQNDTWYVDAKAVLAQAGFSTSVTGNTARLSDGLSELAFTIGSTAVKVNQSGADTLSQPVITQNEIVYFPFISLFDLLGYDLRLNASKTRFSAINAIQMIRVLKIGDQIALNVKTSRHLMIAPSVDWESQRQISLLLPGAYAQFSKNKLNNLSPEIKQLEISPTLNRSTQIDINLTQSLYPLLSQNQNEITLSMAGVLRDLKQRIVGDELIVEISGSTPLSFATSNVQERIVIDFPGVFNYLSVNNASKASIFKQIRSSTLAYSPLSSRVVFDMNTKMVPKFEQPNPNQVNIIFAFPKDYQPATIQAQKGILDGKLIAVDPGHGGSDPGSIAANGRYEKAYTRDISDRLIKLIQENGGTVLDLRAGDESPTLGVRTSQANEANADLFLSIHVNSFTKPYANGTQTYFYKPEDKQLAKFIHKEMLKALGLKDEKLRSARLYVLRFSTMPATLIEPLYLSNPDEFALLETPAIRQKIAQAVYDGTVNYFKSR